MTTVAVELAEDTYQRLQGVAAGRGLRVGAYAAQVLGLAAAGELEAALSLLEVQEVRLGQLEAKAAGMERALLGQTPQAQASGDYPCDRCGVAIPVGVDHCGMCRRDAAVYRACAAAGGCAGAGRYRWAGGWYCYTHWPAAAAVMGP